MENLLYTRIEEYINSIQAKCPRGSDFLEKISGWSKDELFFDILEGSWEKRDLYKILIQVFENHFGMLMGIPWHDAHHMGKRVFRRIEANFKKNNHESSKYSIHPLDRWY